MTDMMCFAVLVLSLLGIVLTLFVVPPALYYTQRWIEYWTVRRERNESKAERIKKTIWGF